jgi:hypothetical protein
MDLRLLLTALLLACNAGYLIWKAKTNPKAEPISTAIASDETETPVNEIVIKGAQRSEQRSTDGLRSSLKSDSEEPGNGLEGR